DSKSDAIRSESPWPIAFCKTLNGQRRMARLFVRLLVTSSSRSRIMGRAYHTAAPGGFGGPQRDAIPQTTRQLFQPSKLFDAQMWCHRRAVFRGQFFDAHARHRSLLS